MHCAENKISSNEISVQVVSSVAVSDAGASERKKNSENHSKMYRAKH
jgi:hypothetical protein